MNLTKYSFNKIVVIGDLSTKIKESNITISLDHINLSGSILEIWFKSELNESDLNILNDLVNNYDYNESIRQDYNPIDLSNKQIVHETSKPLGSFTYFTSIGDDPTNKRNVGNGKTMEIIHNIGDKREQSIYVDFNIKENRTWIHEGYVIWKKAEFDSVSFCIVNKVTPYTNASNTNFMLLDNGIIVPAAGNGNINVELAKIEFVETTIQEVTRKRNHAFWNADYDEELHRFKNLRPAPNGDGLYNIFGKEIVLLKFVNKAMFVNDGFIRLQSADAAEVAEGMRFKFFINTYGQDHDWRAACILTLHRMRTV